MKIDLVANNLKAGMTKANPSVRNDKKILQPDSYIMDISFGIEKDDAVTYSTGDLNGDAENGSRDALSDTISGIKNEFMRAADMSYDIFSKMEELGLSPKDLDSGEIVTVSDQIKMNLAKAGVDISAMGGLSDKAVRAMTGSYAEANALKSDIEKARAMAADVEEKTGNEISSRAASFLIKNNYEPTLENLFKAVYSDGSSDDESLSYAIENADVKDLGINKDEICDCLKRAGVAPDKNAVKEAEWLIKEDIPVNGKNISSLEKLQSEIRSVGEEELNKEADEGRQPEKIMMISGCSMDERVEKALDTIRIISPDDAETAASNGQVLNLRNLRAYSLISAGNADGNAAGNTAVNTAGNAAGNTAGNSVGNSAVNIVENAIDNTAGNQTDYIKLINDAKEYLTYTNLSAFIRFGVDIETEPLSDLLAATSLVDSKPDDAMDTFSKAAEAGKNIEETPVSFLGRYISYDIRKETLGRISVLSSEARGNRAIGTYEAVGTEVRPDLGDNISKVFEDSYKVLDELGMERNDENERAVRILGYNSLDLTRENIEKVSFADSLFNKAIKNLKPSAVLSLLREGKNPLDMTMEELSSDGGEEENDESLYSFLFRLENTNGISDDEKKGFIGIYRLIHEVNETDGAAVGKLIKADIPVTLGNLLTVIRGRKGIDRKVDENTGLTESAGYENSIKDAIENALQKAALRRSEEIITPAKLTGAGGSEKALQMKPDELLTAMENVPEPYDIEKKRIDDIREDIKEAANGTDYAYKVLSAYDIALTPANLYGISGLLRGSSPLASVLKEKELKDVPDYDNACDEYIENELSRDMDSEESMIAAEDRLTALALSEAEVRALSPDGQIDLKMLKGLSRQLSVIKQMSKNEIYHVPVRLSEDYTDMRILFQSGTDKPGRVSAMIETERSGIIYAEIESDKETGHGVISASNTKTLEILKNNESLIRSSIEDEAHIKLDLQCVLNGSIKTSDIYTGNGRNWSGSSMRSEEKKSGGFEKPDTRTLYRIAKALVRASMKVM